MERKSAIVKPTKRILLLLFALLLSSAVVSASVSPAYGATKVKLSKTKASLTVGGTLTLKVTGTKAKVTWSSSSKKVASVTSKGKVKALKAGKTTIKATYKANKKKQTLKCVVTVKAKAVTEPAPEPITTPPTSPSVPPANAAFSKTSVTVPSNDADLAVNYVTVSLPEGSSGYSFTLNGAAAVASPVFTDRTLLKIPVPEGITQAIVAAESNGVGAGSASFSFTAGIEEPDILYGLIPMKFSEYFHDVTADGALPTGTAFPKSGAVAVPELFITQGTRTGNPVGGVDTVTYAEAEEAGLPYVDTVSTATYGDSVHFAPDGNLTLAGNRLVNTDPDKAITGITAAEAGASFDLYANAAILKKLGKATAQSKNVLSKLTGKFTLLNVVGSDGGVIDAAGNAVSASDVYKPKLMLTDGNWGPRSLVNEAAVRNLPGLGNDGEAEGVSYGGNWGDKVTGFSFGDSTALGTYYAGNNYWDNFANNIYGGVVTDSEGHSEPLVFLQNLFSHRAHEDFDVAISPSRFSRLSELKSPDTYTVTVFADGFEDITFSYEVKNYSNASIAVDGATSITAANPAADASLAIKGLDNANSYVTGAKLSKGAAEIDRSLYTLEATSRTKAKLTLKAALFTGSYQGSYTLSYENAFNASKSITFTVINSVSVKLSTTSGGSPIPDGYAQTTPAAVAKAGSNKVYFVDASSADTTSVNDFAKAIVTSARSGYSTIENITDGGAAVAVGTALARATTTDPYYIDVSGSDVFVSGKTYKLTLIASGFNNQIFYISVT